MLRLRRPIVVVTNQSGIRRGYFDENAYADLTRWMCNRFEAEHTAITRVYHCPYHPVDGIDEYRCDHPWRKPKPGMLLQAISDLALDPARCAILGDRMSDIEAGAAAGIGLRVLIRPRHAKTGGPPYEVVVDLGEALALFRSALRQLCLSSAPGMPDARPFKLELGFEVVRWNRRTAVCPRVTVLGAMMPGLRPLSEGAPRNRRSLLFKGGRFAHTNIKSLTTIHEA